MLVEAKDACGHVSITMRTLFSAPNVCWYDGFLSFHKRCHQSRSLEGEDADICTAVPPLAVFLDSEHLVLIPTHTKSPKEKEERDLKRNRHYHLVNWCWQAFNTPFNYRVVFSTEALLPLMYSRSLTPSLRNYHCSIFLLSQLAPPYIPWLPLNIVRNTEENTKRKKPPDFYQVLSMSIKLWHLTSEMRGTGKQTKEELD